MFRSLLLKKARNGLINQAECATAFTTELKKSVVKAALESKFEVKASLRSIAKVNEITKLYGDHVEKLSRMVYVINEVDEKQ